MRYPKPEKKPKKDSKQLKTKERVLKLDKAKCMVIGCGSTFGLTPHHIVNKGQGGIDDVSNEISLCQEHHQIADNGGKIEGEWISKYRFMDELLDGYVGKSCYRWAESHWWIKEKREKQEFKLSQTKEK